MLAPDSRAVLLDQLRPPTGFELDHAVGTTFTLDLTFSLLPPLAFAAMGVNASTNPLAVMASLTKIAERIDIFCQAGQIGIPGDASDLVAFLEAMVHPVQRPRPGRLFHPKIWILKFRAPDDEIAYRLLVSSRNLTWDASWDTLVSLDGTPGSRPVAANKPLVDLLSYLPSVSQRVITPDRAQRISTLAQEIRGVEWERPDNVNQILFHAMGLTRRHSVPDFSGYRILVVSPFLSDGGLTHIVAPRRGDLRVVSRTETLDGLSPAVRASMTSSHIVNPIALLDNENIPPSRFSQLLSGLHAKMYVAERAGAAHLFIGSANATGAAFTGNVEFLVELVGPIKVFGVDALLGPEGIGPILEAYSPAGGQPDDDQREARYRLDEVLRDLAAVPITGTVEPARGQHTMTIASEDSVPLPKGYTAAVSLHTRPGASTELFGDQILDMGFGPMPLADVTAFLMVRVTSPEGLRGGTAVLMEVVNDPPGRLSAILARQLDSTEKFLQFLSLLLSLTSGNSALQGIGSGGAVGPPMSMTTSGVFETLLRALADRPGSLDGLGELIDRLGADETRKDVLPNGLHELWPAIMAAQLQLAEVPV